MFYRLRQWILMTLVAFDQVLHVLLAGPKYIFFGGPRPSPDETISSKVGRMAIEGKRWALISEFLINGMFRIITGEIGHCRNRIGS